MTRGLIGFIGLVWLLGAMAPVSSQPAPVVRIVPMEMLSVAPGVSKDTEIRITVVEGFHVQANPAANEFLIPLKLEFERGDGFEVTDIRYPPGEPYRLQGADEDLQVYGGTFAVPVTVRASADAREEAVAARGRLRYQACDERICLAPATLTFDLTAGRIYPRAIIAPSLLQKPSWNPRQKRL